MRPNELAVSRGIALLQEHMLDLNKINLDRIGMTSAYNCILGQLSPTGKYDCLRDKLLGKSPLVEKMVHYGFAIDLCLAVTSTGWYQIHPNIIRDAAEDLKQEWITQLSELRNKTTKPSQVLEESAI